MVITFESPRAEALPHYPYYYDSDRQLYRYFGMRMAGFWDLWGPHTLLAYLHLLLKGRKILPSKSDIHQRGGDVLIDPQGRIRFHHIGSGPADRPDLENILSLVEKGTLFCREASKADLPFVLRIYAQPDVDDGKVLSLNEAEHFFERTACYPDYHIYVAVCGEQIIGTFALLVMDNLGHLGASSAIIEDVAVDPEWQGRGVGKMMMRYALQKCKDKGCYKAALSSNLTRDKAHTFYESIGFERHGFSFRVSTQQDKFSSREKNRTDV